MALTTCKECKKEVSTAAKVCPHCGYKPKRTSLFTWLVLILIGVGFVSYWSAINDAEERAAAAAKAEAARLTTMTPEQKRAEAEAKSRADAERERQDAAVQSAVVGARLLKKSMNNPDAFKLESALVIENSGAVCYGFRGQNAFGATVPGQAVFAADGKRFLLNTDDGFAGLWNSECAEKSGQEVATAIRWFAL